MKRTFPIADGKDAFHRVPDFARNEWDAVERVLTRFRGATRGRGVGHAAFTLIEILASIALLSFIVLGLFAMFNQVQRAFTSSMNQVDQLEAGRALAELLPAELEQTTPCGANAVTFCVQMAGSSAPFSAPLTQSLPGTNTPPTQRTNYLQDCFILLRTNQTWVGIGYIVRTNDSTGRLWLPETGPASGQLGVGSLYRFTTNLPVLYENPTNLRDPGNGTNQNPSQLYVAFKAAAQPGSAVISNKICDGVIHFCLQTFATNGYPIAFGVNFGTNVACFRTNAFTSGYSVVRQAVPVPNSSYPGYPGNLAGVAFVSNAVPAFVELQLGILEQHAVDRYNSIPVASARLAYLQRPDNTSRVNLFRQRIPIRNVNPAAYQ